MYAPEPRAAWQEVRTIPYRDLTSITVGDPGETIRTTDTGLIGGGLGVKGSLEGIAIARAVNHLTRRSTQTFDTVVTVLARACAVALRNTFLPPQELAKLLAPVYEGIRSAPRPRAGAPAPLGSRAESASRSRIAGKRRRPT